MNRMRILTMAVLAVFCIGAISASAAFATGKGEIVNKTGVAPVKNKFTGSSNKKGKLETVAGSKIECETTAISAGTIASKTTGSATFTFTGCQTGGSNCKTATATKAGEVIVAVNLKGVGKGTAGSDDILNTVPETTITCASLGVTIVVKGSLLIPATPENSLKTEFEFNAKGSKGVQEPEDTEAPLEAKFSNSASKAFEHASLSATELKVKFEEEVEFI